MMEPEPRCPCCTEKYSTDDDDARLPVVLSCLCTICKGCALQQETEAAAAAAAAAAAVGGKKNKGKGKGKKKKKEEEAVQHNNGMVCQICNKVCTTPVADLLIDIAMVKTIESSSAAAAPLCAFCAEEQATKYCNDCLPVQRMLCDSCHASFHSYPKQKGHTSIPVEEHLASAGSHGTSGSAAHKPTAMCSIHAGQPLQIYCNTCNVLVCALCAVLQHNGHDFTPVEQAADAHRETIEAALTVVTVSRAEVVAAIAAIKVIKGQLQGNKDAANKVIEEGFKKLMQAARERRDALKQLVEGAYSEKLAALEAQLSALEEVDCNSEAALALVVATLAAATPTELLARSSLLENGLGQLHAHGVPLEECRGAIIRMVSNVTFEQKAAEMRALGEIETADTNPAASAAAGDGLKCATVGKEAMFVVTAFEAGSAGQKPRSSGGDDVTIRFVCVGNDDDDDDSAGANTGGGGGVAAKNRKRKRGSATASEKGHAGAKKSKTGTSTFSSSGGGAAAATYDADVDDFDDIVADNGDGTYTCSYTAPEGAETKQWQLEVLLNGNQIAGSPFAVEVKGLSSIKYVFRSIADGEYTYLEGGTVATKVKHNSWTGAICDGQLLGGGAVAAAAAPMVEGKHHAQFGIVKNDTGDMGRFVGLWCFGVCRSGIDLNDGKDFESRDDTWMMYQDNTPRWYLSCNSNKGNFFMNSIKRELHAGDRVGLVLDLDNGGTLTLYLDGKPCGTIAEGLVGPLHWCIMSYGAGKVVRIHAGLEIPPQ